MARPGPPNITRTQTMPSSAIMVVGSLASEPVQPAQLHRDLRKLHKSDSDAYLLLEIGLTDDGRLFRRPRFIRNPIKLNDRPALELYLVQRSEDSRKVDAATAELHELERIFCFGRIGGNVVDVLQVKEQKAVVILFDRLSRVPSASDKVGSIELKLDVFRISAFEDEIQARRTLTESVEMIVIAERNAEIGSSFAQFSKEAAKTFALIGCGR